MTLNKVFILRERRILDNFLSFVAANWEAMSRTKTPMQITIQPESKKRSLQANKYYWNVINQIAESVWMEGRQYLPEVWHEQAKRKFIGCVDMPGGGLMSMSTTDLSTAEFQIYVTKVECWAASELGVTFMDREFVA